MLVGRLDGTVNVHLHITGRGRFFIFGYFLAHLGCRRDMLLNGYGHGRSVGGGVKVCIYIGVGRSIVAGFCQFD